MGETIQVKEMSVRTISIPVKWIWPIVVAAVLFITAIDYRISSAIDKVSEKVDQTISLLGKTREEVVELRVLVGVGLNKKN